jgi:antagonist of KipI
MLELLDGGLLTTIQDHGRPGLGQLGVPEGGACDPWALAVANLLVDNDPGAATIECTLIGPEFRVLAPIVVGLAGADLGGIERSTGRRLLPGASYALPREAVVAFPGPPDGETGCRAYLALPGGIDVPPVLGSASTCLAGSFGGLDGRPLRAGDRIGPRRPGEEHAEHRWPDAVLSGVRPGMVRIVEGPEPPSARSAFERLVGGAWTVAPESDRMGLRLAGEPLAAIGTGETLSHGLTWGTIQLPSDGRPIVLLADHQPTGGYPVVAVAIVADRPALGQLRPGSAVRFVDATVEQARAALRDQRDSLQAGADALAAIRRWDDLWRSARG